MNSPTVMAPSFCLAPTAVDSRVRRFQALALSLSALLALLAASTAGAAGILQIKNGYFWDPLQQNYFIPRGFGYQTFNPPVGADQSLEQLAYDFTEFKKLYANSSRVEMVWNQVETAHGV